MILTAKEKLEILKSRLEKFESLTNGSDYLFGFSNENALNQLDKVKSACEELCGSFEKHKRFVQSKHFKGE